MKGVVWTVVAIVIFAGIVSSCDGSSKSSSGGGGGGYACSIGDVHRVKGSDTTWGISKDAWNQASDAVASNDQEGFALLFADGEVYNLDPGTKVRVLDTGWTGTAKVRVLSGEHIYEEAWGSCDWLK